VTIANGRIAAYDAVLERHDVGGTAVALWRVADLERHVDRAALLAGDDPREPPYWAHLWSGAKILASAVPCHAGRVIEIGCGLGLPGVVAARRGARAVVCVDRETTPLAFVRASARASRTGCVSCVAADVAALPFGATFDLVLVAELLYDRALFAPIAHALAALLGPGGRLLLADARRIDTAAFYPALDAAGLDWRATAVPVMEEGFPIEVRLVEARRRQARPYLRSFR